jgi:hypothetical protein
MKNALFLLTLLGAGMATLARAAAGEGVPNEGVSLHNLKVLSDKIDDVTTTENILQSFTRPGMSEAERARALWTAAVKYRHQGPPPDELLVAETEVHDPVKLFNVYGYCMCCCGASLIEALNRLDGREARGRILTGHSVAEVKYGGSWHMFDPSLVNFFPKPGSEVVASVDEISAAVRAWYASHPEYKGKQAMLDQLMRSEQWTGWKADGPELLAHCPYYRLGFFPAGTHGWNSTMVEYDGDCGMYEYGYQVGHRALFSLRPGESLVREAGNRRLHVNADPVPQGPTEDHDYLNSMLKARAPQDDLAYLKDFYPGYRGGIIANGYHRYVPDLASGGLARGAEVYENLTSGGSPALHCKAAGQPGVAVVALTSPYVYLGGRLTLQAVRRSAESRVTVSISTNNGRSFTPLWQADGIGVCRASLDLNEKIRRRYAYWLKIEIFSPSTEGAGLDTLAIDNDIQYAPRTLPWLGRGANKIRVVADQDTTLASRAITGRISPDATFRKNETTGSLGVTFENLKMADGSCSWKGGIGTMTVPVATPGDLAALRLSTHFCAMGKEDHIRILLSVDEGKSWKEAAVLAGPTPGRTDALRLAGLPQGVTRALVRYELSGTNTIAMYSFRIDADYRDPLATANASPFAVIYRWKEDGHLKSHRAWVTHLPFTYTIETTSEPEMESVTCEMPAN